MASAYTKKNPYYIITLKYHNLLEIEETLFIGFFRQLRNIGIYLLNVLKNSLGSRHTAVSILHYLPQNTCYFACLIRAPSITQKPNFHEWTHFDFAQRLLEGRGGWHRLFLIREILWNKSCFHRRKASMITILELARVTLALYLINCYRTFH